MMRHFTKASIKLGDEWKKLKIVEGEKVLKIKSKNKKIKKYPSLIRQRYMHSKEQNAELVVECLASSPRRF